MQHPCFFGFGSLVNTATHAYPNPRRAEVQGWRRLWRHTGLRKAAFLSVAPAPETRLQGVIAEVPGNDWAALDLREYAYDRHRISSDQVAMKGQPPDDVQIYATKPEISTAPDDKHPILLSYLDVVVQGYLREFGRDGVRAFFETTDGWDAPVLDDRIAPIYSRALPLDPAERAIVDFELGRLSPVIQHREHAG